MILEGGNVDHVNEYTNIFKHAVNEFNNVHPYVNFYQKKKEKGMTL